MSKKLVKIKASKTNVVNFFKLYNLTALKIAELTTEKNETLKKLKREIVTAETSLQLWLDENLITDSTRLNNASEQTKIEFNALNEKVEELQAKYDDVEKDFNDEIRAYQKWQKKCLYIVSPKLYEGYMQKITEQKRGLFLEGIRELTDLLGIESPKQSEISGTAEALSDLIGTKHAGAKKITEGKKLTTPLSFTSFQKLFMSSFCDLYVVLNKKDFNSLEKYQDYVASIVEKSTVEVTK